MIVVVFPVAIPIVVVIRHELHGLATDPVAFLLLVGILFWFVIVVGTHGCTFVRGSSRKANYSARCVGSPLDQSDTAPNKTNKTVVTI